MVDAATIGVYVGIASLGLTVVWLLKSDFKNRELLKSLGRLVNTLVKEREASGDLKREELLQRQREQQYRETRDLFKALGWLWERFSEEDEDDYE